MEKPNIILQLKDYLKNNYVIKKNADSGWVEVDGRKLDLYCMNTLYLDCKVIYPKTTKHILKCILNSDFVEVYNERPKK